MKNIVTRWVEVKEKASKELVRIQNAYNAIFAAIKAECGQMVDEIAWWEEMRKASGCDFFNGCVGNKTAYLRCERKGHWKVNISLAEKMVEKLTNFTDGAVRQLAELVLEKQQD